MRFLAAALAILGIIIQYRSAVASDRTEKSREAEPPKTDKDAKPAKGAPGKGASK